MAKIRLAAKLIWLLSLFTLLLPINPANAYLGTVKWSRVNIPTAGRLGNWMLADDSDVQHLTMATDGTLYCYAVAKINGTDTEMLFKSIADGQSWQETDYEGNAITDIACSNFDADIIYVTDGSHVYKSKDAGDSFSELASTSLPTLDTNESISCIDVGYKEDKPQVFIGTADTDASDFGSVYYLPEAGFGAKWTDLETGNFDVYSIACSPQFADDSQIIAVVTDESHTYMVNNHGVIGEWTDEVELLEGNTTSFAITAASDVCLPDDFTQEYELFVGVVSSTGGDVYRADADNAYDLGVDASIISLDMVGNIGDTQLLAGENDAAEVWSSPDGGNSWQTSDKAPSGDSLTYVVMAPDFTSQGRAFASTSGSESAFSCTTDGGITWNQTGLIDTAISTIIDLAVSPGYDRDNTLFMLTNCIGGDYSLWRSLSGGDRWERVFTSTLADAGRLNLVALSPQYGDSNRVVFIAGTSGSNSAIWKSTDNGQDFSSRRVASASIDVWTVVDDNSLFTGSYDGSNGLVYHTTNSGLSYPTGTIVGSQPLNSIVLSPDYARDETILIGNTDGWVYWSDDDGSSFEPLPPDAVSAPLAGSVTVASDPKFASNSTVYAASDTADKGIYRFTIGKDVDWESIDTTLPSGGRLGQLIASTDGTLYAANFKADGGMERSLNPAYSLGPTFETVTRGLDEDATLTKLWLQGNQLWSTDSYNVRLMTFTDSLTPPVTLTSPRDNAPGIGTLNDTEISSVSLDWGTLEGATEYEWQLDYDTDFSTAPVPFEGDTKASSARLSDLEPDTTYYWRVRATEPMLSPWSTKWSFTTSFGNEATAPKLLYPEAGASEVPLKPVLQWNAVAGAEKYELIVSTDVALSNPSILKMDSYALPSTAWECNISLNYNTTYYWKVRAINDDTCSAWSAVGAFTTEPQPEETLAPPPSSTPTPAPAPPSPPAPAPAQLTTPDWVKYLIGALFLTIILLIITMLAMVAIVRRP